MQKKCFYEVLGLATTVSTTEIKKHWHSLVKVIHPDKGGSHQGFIDAKEAFDILVDDSARAAYDNLLRHRANARQFANATFVSPSKTNKRPSPSTSTSASTSSQSHNNGAASSRSSNKQTKAQREAYLAEGYVPAVDDERMRRMKAALYENEMREAEERFSQEAQRVSRESEIRRRSYNREVLASWLDDAVDVDGSADAEVNPDDCVVVVTWKESECTITKELLDKVFARYGPVNAVALSSSSLKAIISFSCPEHARAALFASVHMQAGGLVGVSSELSVVTMTDHKQRLGSKKKAKRVITTNDYESLSSMEARRAAERAALIAAMTDGDS